MLLKNPSFIAKLAWATLLGLWSWGPVGHPAAALLVFAVWGCARTRFEIGAMSMAYFLAGQTDLLAMPGRFYALSGAFNFVAGLAVWVGWSALGALAMTLCWRRRFPALSLLVGLVVITVPPLGWLVMANPLHAAGWWFPGTDAAGFIVTIGLAYVLAKLPEVYGSTQKAWPPVVGTLGAMMLGVCVTHIFYREPVSPQSIVAVDTQWGAFPVESRLTWQRTEAINRTVEHAASISNSAAFVFPEMVLGTWNAKTQYWLEPTIAATRQTNIVVVAGVVHPPDAQHTQARNGMVLIENGKARWLAGRIPMPGGDWHLDKSGYQASPWEVPVVNLGALRAVVSVCYEDALVWTHLQNLLQSSDVHISIASLWWADGLSSVDRRMRLMSQGWARLESVPWLRAVNRSPHAEKALVLRSSSNSPYQFRVLSLA